MPKAKHFKKEEILAAMAKTKSVKSAARYLNCSYQHLKKWMKIYQGEDGKTLFEQHKNQQGKGIPKFASNKPFGRKEPAILDIMRTYRDWETDRKSTRLNSSHSAKSRMPSSA